ESGIQRRPTRLPKSNEGRLVPDDVAGTKQLDQHHHVDRIHRPVETSAKYRADVISRPPGQWHANSDFVPVGGDVRDPASRAAVGGKQVEPPTHQTRAPSLGDGRHPILSTAW